MSRAFASLGNAQAPSLTDQEAQRHGICSAGPEAVHVPDRLADELTSIGTSHSLASGHQMGSKNVPQATIQASMVKVTDEHGFPMGIGNSGVLLASPQTKQGSATNAAVVTSALDPGRRNYCESEGSGTLDSWSVAGRASAHRHRRGLRSRLNVPAQNLRFNVMVAGQSGNGKSTAVTAMLRGWNRSATLMPYHRDVPKTKEISLVGRYQHEDDESNTIMQVEVYDSPGYGDTMNNAEAIEPIATWVQSKLKDQYDAERSVHGTTEDRQIHCCLYFIPPQRLHEVDKEFMKRLQQEVPVIPLIAKADTLTNQELMRQREEVTRQLRDAGINWYNFDDLCQGMNVHAPEEESVETRPAPDPVLEGRGRLEGQPLAIIARDGEYPWGRSSVMNPEHSDFLELQDNLLRIHPKNLIEQATVKYQDFRAQLIKKEKQAAQRDQGWNRTIKWLTISSAMMVFVAAVFGPNAWEVHQRVLSQNQGITPQFYLPFPADRTVIVGGGPRSLFSENEEAVRGISPMDNTWLQMNVSVRKGMLKLSPRCKTNKTNVFELVVPPTDERLHLAGIPSSLNQCLKELQFQHVAEHRHGETQVIFNWTASGQAASKEIPLKIRAAAEANHTKVEGDGIQMGKPALSAAELTITGHDGLDLRCLGGGDICAVDVRGRFAKGSPMQNMTVATNDNKDGTYTAMFIVPYGEYMVSVWMNGELVLPVHTVKSSDPVAEVETMQIHGELGKLKLAHQNLTSSLHQTSMNNEKLIGQLEQKDKDMCALRNHLNLTERMKIDMEFNTNRTIEDLSSKFGTATVHLNNVTASRDSCQAQLGKRQGELETCRLEFSNCSGEKDHLKADLARIIGDRDQLKADLKRITGDRDHLKADLNKRTRESDSLEMDNTKLSRELKNCMANQTILGVAKSDLGKCQKELDQVLKVQEEQRRHQEALSANKPPTVKANGNHEITVDEEYVLHATATDPEGHPLAYHWSMIQGTEPSILEGNWNSSTLKIKITGLGIHTFNVTVMDTLGGAHSDLVNIHVRPRVGVGIDLGTTYSCISLSTNGVPAAWIADPKYGLICMPSVVGFSRKRGAVVGQEALESPDCEPQYLISEAKRLMGLRRDDPAVAFQKDSVHYKIDNLTVSGMVDSAQVVVRQKDGWIASGSEALLLPEQISAMILNRLWDVCADKIGAQACRHAVVTAPAQFSDGQRKATKDAIRLSKWELIKILPEPTAAAFGFGILQNLDTSKLYYILVGDLGGGTYDCTLLQVKHRSFKVLATSGDNHFGGKDFDRCIARRLMANFHRDYGSFEESEELQHLINLEAEKAKRTLSEKNAADVHVKDAKGAVLQTTLTRSDFEGECVDLFNRIPKVLLQVLTDRHLTPDDVNIMLPVGGSSRMPRARQLYGETFPKAVIPDFDASFDPEMAVVKGAALVAEYIVKDPTALPMDVTPLSLGVPEMKPMLTGAAEAKTASGVELHVFSEFDRLSADVQSFHVGVQVLPPPSAASSNPVQSAVSIFMVIDVSGSMRETDAGGSVKLESVQHAVLAIVDRLPEEAKLFICTFSYTACEERLPLTLMDVPGKDSARTLLRGLQPRGSTNMMAGVDAAIQEMHRAVTSDGLDQVALMLLTDGVPNSGDASEQLLRNAALKFSEKEVSMVASTIGFGNPNKRNNLNGALLSLLAEVGGGHYYYAQDGTVVDKIMTEVIQDAQQTVGRQAKLEVMAVAGFKFSSFPETCTMDSDARKVSCVLKAISTFRQEVLLEVDGSTRTYTQVANSMVQVVSAALGYVGGSGSQPLHEEVTASLQVAETPESSAVLIGGRYQEELCQMKTRRLLKQQKFAEAKSQADLCQDSQLKANVEQMQGLRDEERFSQVSIIDKNNLVAAAQASVLREQTCVVVPRHSLYPTRRSIVKQTYQHGQTEVLIRVYEGEDEYPDKNHLLGDFTLGGIPPMPAGQADVEITFELDNDGILTVQGSCKQGGSSKGLKLNVASKDGRLKDVDLEVLRTNLQTYG